MEEHLKNIAKFTETSKPKADEKNLTVEKVEAEYNPIFGNRIKDTVLLSEKLDQTLSIVGFNTYDFSKKEAQLNFMMLNGTIVDLFAFFEISPSEVKNESDWENYIYKVLGEEYVVNSNLYLLNQKEFTKEIKAILNLNRADFLSEDDRGKEAKDQNDFNKLIKEIEKIIKKNFHLGVIGLLQSCKKIMEFYQEKYSLEETFDFYERYKVLKGFKIFKTFRKYNDKYERNRKITPNELLGGKKYLGYYDSSDELERQTYFGALLEDLKKYEPHIRNTIKKSKTEKELSKNIRQTFVNYYKYSLLTMYHTTLTEGAFATAKSILWQEISFDGENEDILREAISEVREIIDDNKEIDWNPKTISKVVGITKGRAEQYKLYFLYATVYKSAKSRTTDWRHRNGGRPREQYRKDIKVPQKTLKLVAKLKEQGKTNKEIAEIIKMSSRTVDNYWKKYRDSLK